MGLGLATLFIFPALGIFAGLALLLTITGLVVTAFWIFMIIGEFIFPH